MKGITPFLWFNDDAEKAIQFYTSVFKNSKVGHISRYGDSGPGPKGQVMVGEFELNGQPFMALNGGPQFKFNESVSFVIRCENQEEIDYYWSKLSADGGQESMCGWLKDPFGLSWQVVPSVLSQLMTGPNAGRVMQALLQMRKLDIATLQKAAA
ncbi:MAG TPA: VOC family protein [Candidatus Eisenbacteria bacterium]|nr:VOC family protein [Candidatus Eisenbacteria bacterium]